jgi:hypothetical protein
LPSCREPTSIPITGSLGFKKSEVTAGGVALAEVDSRTMQSKRPANLYLAGEILDLDGPIRRLQLSGRLRYRLAGRRKRIAELLIYYDSPEMGMSSCR